MVYVNRDENGEIRCVYALPIEGHAEEEVDESSPELAAFYEKASEAHLNE
jgi:hypothetical protein